MDTEIRYLLDRGDEGDDEEALRLCDQFLLSSPGDAEALVLKAEALRNLDMYSDAVDAARQSTLARNGAASTHLALGQALLDLADEEEDDSLLPQAEEALRDAVDRDGDDAVARYWLAETHVRLGDPTTAVEELARLGVSTDWRGPGLARMLRLIADGAGPRPPIERPSRLCHPDACRALAIALREQGGFASALLELDEAEADDPLSPETTYQKAVTLACLGRYSDALTELEHPLLFPGFAEAQELAALCQAQAEPQLASPLVEIPLAASREKRVITAFGSLTDYYQAMVKVALGRFEQASDPSVTARTVARTARHYAPTRLADDAWKQCGNQMADAWETMTTTERLRVSGLLVMGEWLAGAAGLPGLDCTILAAAAVATIEAATETRDAGSELLGQVRALREAVADAERPMSREIAWALVGHVVGAPGEQGVLHAVASASRKEKAG